MNQRDQELKCRIGAVLLRLHCRQFVLDEGQTAIAGMLVDRGLARFVGTHPSARNGMVEETNAYRFALADSHYELTSEGESFVEAQSEPHLANGRFTLPGDPRWYDDWFWKGFVTVAFGILFAVLGVVVMMFLSMM